LYEDRILFGGFPDLPIEAIADWAVQKGFDGLEIDFNRHIIDGALSG